MDEPFDGEQAAPASATPGGPRDRSGKYPVARAGLVCAVFVIGAILLLATIHPSKPTTVVAGAVVTTTSTTSGASAVTTVVAPTTTTHAHSGHGGHHASTTTTTTVVTPTGVPVLVANGSDVSGAAAAFSARLKTAGWTTLPPTNATTQVTTSHVYYLPGQQSAATVAAIQLKIPAAQIAPYSASVPVSSIGTAEVVVVLGPDIASSSSTATTSAASSSTTTG